MWVAGMAGGLRASGPKADLALIVADADAVAAGVFTTNVMCAAPVLYCKKVLAKNKPARAVRHLSSIHRSTLHHCSWQFATTCHLLIFANTREQPTSQCSLSIT